jgi:hypothetical protein
MTKSRGINTPRRAWTQAELALLNANYATTRASDIAAQLGRPLGSAAFTTEKVES